MEQNNGEDDEKDHAQNRAAERIASKQEMRQRSAQQKNCKGDDHWVAHGGNRCFRKPAHLAASPVMLYAGLILNVGPPADKSRRHMPRMARDYTKPLHLR